MKSYQTSVKLTRFATWGIALLMAVLLFLFPALVEFYHREFRPLDDATRMSVLRAFYCCAAAVLFALWHMDRLLRNISRAELFTTENVRHIRTIRWCCLAVSMLCLTAAAGFPSLLFASAIMIFLCLVVTVVGQVMASAVELREENDLTV